MRHINPAERKEVSLHSGVICLVCVLYHTAGICCLPSESINMTLSNTLVIVFPENKHNRKFSLFLSVHARI